MRFYTFVLEFEGGTYVAQVNARSHAQAPAAWAAGRAPGEIRGMGPASLQELRAAMEKDEPTPLAGLVHAWCVSALVGGRLALVHFFETTAPSVMANRAVEGGPPTAAAHLRR